MRVTDNEYADPAVQEPKVTGAPDTIYLNYGDIEHDDTHRECCASGEVTWCEDGVFASDVQYLRGDHLDGMIAVAVAAERERRYALATDFREYLYRVASQVPFEHAEWANELVSALLAALRA